LNIAEDILVKRNFDEFVKERLVRSAYFANLLSFIH
jgi:hypothetical protein